MACCDFAKNFLQIKLPHARFWKNLGLIVGNVMMYVDMMKPSKISWITYASLVSQNAIDSTPLFYDEPVVRFDECLNVVNFDFEEKGKIASNFQEFFDKPLKLEQKHSNEKNRYFV